MSRTQMERGGLRYQSTILSRKIVCTFALTTGKRVVCVKNTMYNHINTKYTYTFSEQLLFTLIQKNSESILIIEHACQEMHVCRDIFLFFLDNALELLIGTSAHVCVCGSESGGQSRFPVCSNTWLLILSSSSLSTEREGSETIACVPL